MQERFPVGPGLSFEDVPEAPAAPAAADLGARDAHAEVALALDGGRGPVHLGGPPLLGVVPEQRSSPPIRSHLSW